MTTPVTVAASGVVCGLGAGARALWTGLLAGRCAFCDCPELGPGARAAAVPDSALPAEAGLDRTDALLEAALAQITGTAAWGAVDPRRLGVAIGTTQGPIQRWSADQAAARARPDHRPAPPDIAAPVLRLARRVGAGGPVHCPSMACASGAAAIAAAADWIAAGRCDAALAGGVDALSRFVHAGFSRLKALDPDRPRPFDRDRAGLGLGEGAGLLLLRRPVDDGPVVAGWGLSADANHLTGPDPTGSGVSRATDAALRDAGVAPAGVDHVNAHGTGTRYNDLMEGKGLVRSLGRAAERIPVSSIKGSIGHTMAAAGAIEAVLCALILERGAVPPTVNLEQPDPDIPLDLVQGAPRRLNAGCVLSTSSGFGGVNAALILRA